MSNRRDNAVFAVVLLSLAMLLVMRSDWAVDEAKLAGLTAADFRMADEPYFDGMDQGLSEPLSRDEIVGRNMWMVWSGGNDRFWDEFSRLTFGSFDLLKVISTNPNDRIVTGRANRWAKYGIVNEPCFKPAEGPDRYGLWRDVRDPSCPEDPFASEKSYPGVKIGQRGKNVPRGSYYGEPTGIVGLRLFPNPDFDAEAEKKWDMAKSYYCPLAPNDPSPKVPSTGRQKRDECKNANSKLIRPYRVGMTCAFCHAGPRPTHPPENPASPAWSDLGPIVGAQFMNIKEVFLPELEDDSFLSQILKTYNHGALDTSLVATDSVNNPRTMNAIYSLLDRMTIAKRLGEEKLSGGALRNKQFNDFITSGPLTEFFKAPDTVYTPHILKDGADSVGPLGALNRVYVNIGTFSEEWLKHFNPLIGGYPTSPFEIKIAQANSVYWRVTEANTVKVAQYFLRVGKPDLLKDAPGGDKIIEPDLQSGAVDSGKIVFATTCARCHSSRGPTAPPGIRNCRATTDHLTCFKEWWNWTKTDNYKQAMTAIVQRPNFATDNYLSSDVRIPVTLMRTNACSTAAPNATADRVWNDFSSQTYKDLPSVGAIGVRDPFTGVRGTFVLPGGGRGYTRPPSLISAWATAPFFLNNALGPTAKDPSVASRIEAFDKAMKQLLWPETREKDAILGEQGVGLIRRNTENSWIFVSAKYMVPPFGVLALWPKRLWPERYETFFPPSGGIKLGPVPKDLPVNLITNTRVGLNWDTIVALPTLVSKVDAGAELVTEDPEDKRKRLYGHYASFADTMLRLSTCKDFEVNRGHYFGTAQFNDTTGLTEDEKAFLPEPVLTDKQKLDLIAYLKTL